MASPIRVIDSHTEGEPTRVVVSGFPDLFGDTVAEKRDGFAKRFDDLRQAIVCEPRGHDAIVGALLVEPSDPAADVGVIFFNNVGMLGMCGHGTIGLAVTLAHQGYAGSKLTIETPVGLVKAELVGPNRAKIENVESWVVKTDVTVDVPGHGVVTGDIVYGGNWFFLCSDHGKDLAFENKNDLLAYSSLLRQTMEADGSSTQETPIAHVDLFGPPLRSDADSRNFVLCPGLEYDRSPCGTGLSAKLASLAHRGKLAPGEVWRQEGFAGGLFVGSYQPGEKGVIPTIEGGAWITAETELLFEETDPFRMGIG